MPEDKASETPVNAGPIGNFVIKAMQAGPAQVITLFALVLVGLTVWDRYETRDDRHHERQLLLTTITDMRATDRETVQRISAEDRDSRAVAQASHSALHKEMLTELIRHSEEEGSKYRKTIEMLFVEVGRLTKKSPFEEEVPTTAVAPPPKEKQTSCPRN